MKRWVGALAFLGVTATASAAMGQEIQIRGPLAGAPSCRRCVQYRAGRLSLAPTFGLTLQDEFDRTMFLGVQANYHFNEIFALGAYFGFGAVHIPTALTNQIQERLTEADRNGSRAPTPNIPTGSNFLQQIGQLRWMAALQATLIPLRGKLALFQNIFIDSDFYIFAGPALVGVEERADFDAGFDSDGRPIGLPNEAVVNSQTARSSRIAPTGTFGVGLNFFINRFLSLSVEYRAFPFAWNTMGTDENSTANTCGATARGEGSCQGFPDYQVNRDTMNGPDRGGRFLLDANDRSFRWNQMVNFSFNVFLPTEPRIGE
jgi:outer membrane beta-barrel protein